MGIVGELHKANEKLQVQSDGNHSFVMVWQPSASGLFKANSDAAIFSEGRTSIGGVIRDSEGEALLALSQVFDVALDVGIAEAIAMRELIKVA